MSISDDSHIIRDNITLLDALDALNCLSGEVMTLLVIDAQGHMCGTLTDGDIRRSLLKGANLLDKVRDVMHRNFRYLTGSTPDVAEIKRCRQQGITLLPMLNDNGNIIKIYDLSKCRSALPINAILMAGGRGERLRPLTLSTPKPLLKICDKSIIDYNIEALASNGIDDITVTTNYMAEQIHDHFSQPICGINVKCIKEPTFLGTIGATSLIRHKSGGITLVMNSDLLTTISYEDFYINHIEQNADISIATVPYTVSVPYAILDIDETKVNSLQEKPTFTYQANAGIYLFNNDILSSVKPNKRLDAPDLITQSITQGRKVVYFPINGTWIDIGSPNDFKQAQELMRHHNDLNT